MPRDDAFWRLFVQDATAPDPFLLDDDFRLRTLVKHLTAGRYFSKDMKTGQEIVMADGKSRLKVNKDVDGEIILNDGRQDIRVLGDEVFVYNLGNIFFVDKVLFTATSDVIGVMESNEKGEHEREMIEKRPEGAPVETKSVEDFGSPSPPSEFEKASVRREESEDGVRLQSKTSPRATRYVSTV